MALRLSLGFAAVALVLMIASVLPWPGAAVDKAGDAPRAYSAEEVAYGKALFSAKGCATCHQHAAIAGSGQFSGGPGGSPPILTDRPADPAYQRAWLRDPKAVKPTATMPNLDLSEPEIDALIAFLQSDLRPLRRGDPDTDLTTRTWATWDQPATRAWFARALWLALNTPVQR